MQRVFALVPMAAWAPRLLPVQLDLTDLRAGAFWLWRLFTGSVASTPALREYSACHQLDLMKKHQRQNDRANRMRGKNHLGHWNPRGEALFRSAKNDRDLICPVEAQPLAGERRYSQRERQQDYVHYNQSAQRLQRNGVPDALIHRFAERDIHDQQDRALIDEAQDASILLEPFDDQGPQQLPRNKRHEQLQHDIADRVPCGTGVTAAVRHHETDQRGRDEDAEQARRRGSANRCRHIALGNGGERDRRLHGGRQRAQEQNAHVQRGRDERREDGFQRQAEQGKQHESAEQYNDVQTPVGHARHYRFAGELRTVKEKQQSDRNVGQPVEADRRRAAARQQAGKDHRAYECKGEVIGEKLGAGHREFACS